MSADQPITTGVKLARLQAVAASHDAGPLVCVCGFCRAVEQLSVGGSFDRALVHTPAAAQEPAVVDGSLTLRDRVATVLAEHVAGFQYDGPSGHCDSEDCTFTGYQAIGTGGRIGPGELELQAGHQADLLLPIIKEEAAAMAARETKMARDANRAAIEHWNRADTLQAAVDRARALHNADGLRWVGFPRADRQEAYCQGCNKAAPCPDMQALEGDKNE